FMSAVQDAVSSAWEKLSGMFGHRDFSGDYGLASSPNIDPRFIPRVPMGNGDLDMHLLSELGKMGMKRGKEITAQTHPELHQEWRTLCQRAGHTRVPQLILAESPMMNAASLTHENAVVLTTGLLKRLDLREVRAVLGHELGHEVSNHTKSRALAIGLLGGGAVIAADRMAHRGGIGAYIPYDKMETGRLKKVLQFITGKGGKHLSPLDSVIYMLVGGSLGLIAANQVSVRPTELDADRKGAMISGDPEGLILALGKLEEGRGRPSLYKLYRKIQSGYPSTETRIERLRQMAANMPPASPVAAAAPVSPEVPAPGQQIHAATQVSRVVPEVAAHATL
ncbi:MAG: M48 family metallopeptidase, partial [Rickettsiales bacterium]